MSPRIALDRGAIAEFCRRWTVTELALFGSVLRDDFQPDSDVDVLVSFAPGAHRSLFDLARMQEELKGLLGHEVDLLTRRGVEASQNWLRRQAILSSAQVVYVA
jgi:predicted nucleotidyltransferase